MKNQVCHPPMPITNIEKLMSQMEKKINDLRHENDVLRTCLANLRQCLNAITVPGEYEKELKAARKLLKRPPQ